MLCAQLKYLITLIAIAISLFTGFAFATAVRADNSRPVTIRAQGNAYLTDFIARSSKRGDLRLNMASKGMNCRTMKMCRQQQLACCR